MKDIKEKFNKDIEILEKNWNSWNKKFNKSNKRNLNWSLSSSLDQIKNVIPWFEDKVNVFEHAGRGREKKNLNGKWKTWDNIESPNLWIIDREAEKVKPKEGIK
jgi:hypothetical protein